MEIGFRDFLLNENRAYLGQRLGDILNALQDLNDNAQGLGTRQLVSNSENIVNQIRRILHTRWSDREEPHLKTLQKVGVGIMKAIEEKDDLPGVLQSASQEVEQLMGRLDVPANKLATPPETESPQGDDGKQEPSPPEEPPSEPTQAPQGAPQPGPQAPAPGGMPQPMPPAGGPPAAPGGPMPPMPPGPM
jgi:hypothetical protein